AWSFGRPWASTRNNTDIVLRDVRILRRKETGGTRNKRIREAPGNQTLVAWALRIVRIQSRRRIPHESLGDAGAVGRDRRPSAVDPFGAGWIIRRHGERRVAHP